MTDKIEDDNYTFPKRERDKLNEFIGKTIKDIKLNKEKNTFTINFDDSSFTISDEGQSCCETRYLKCDDDLIYLIGQEFNGIKAKSLTVTETYECHEITFIEIIGSYYSIILNAHNEHNGYYGGFDICITVNHAPKPLLEEIK